VVTIALTRVLIREIESKSFDAREYRSLQRESRRYWLLADDFPVSIMANRFAPT
jgi:hypothetical protein